MGYLCVQRRMRGQQARRLTQAHKNVISSRKTTKPVLRSQQTSSARCGVLRHCEERLRLRLRLRLCDPTCVQGAGTERPKRQRGPHTSLSLRRQTHLCTGTTTSLRCLAADRVCVFVTGPCVLLAHSCEMGHGVQGAGHSQPAVSLPAAITKPAPHRHHHLICEGHPTELQQQSGCLASGCAVKDIHGQGGGSSKG